LQSSFRFSITASTRPKAVRLVLNDVERESIVKTRATVCTAFAHSLVETF